MFITRMALPRRTFVRSSLGVAIALPFLDAMVPALAAKNATKPTPRLGFMYVPNGTVPGWWFPAGESGADYRLPRILAPLEPVRKDVLVFSGLDHRQAISQNDGNNQHQRASAVWLSGIHARTTTIGAEIRLGTTADQVAASVLGRETAMPSLEYTLEPANVMSCDGALCLYQNTVSWRTPTTPLPMEDQPRVIFERLFGDGGTPAQRAAQIRLNASILDSVTNEVVRLQRAIGPDDRKKLSEYLDAIRDVELRIQRSEREGSASPLNLPNRPTDVPEDFEAHVNLMFDMHVLAYQGDVTRVVSMFIGREASSRTYPIIGVRDPHHSVSHHRNDPSLMEQKTKIDTYHIDLYRRFIERLRITPDGDGTLLDHSMIMYGGAISDGNLHTHTNVPTLVAGGAGLRVKTGRYLKYRDVPVANLLLMMLDKAGVPTEKLGDSTGTLELEPLSVV